MRLGVHFIIFMTFFASLSSQAETKTVSVRLPASTPQREEFRCSLRISTDFRSPPDQRKYRVDIANQPIILGMSEDSLDMQPIFEGRALRRAYLDEIQIMGIIYRNPLGRKMVKIGMYRHNILSQKDSAEHPAIQPLLETEAPFQSHGHYDLESTAREGNNLYDVYTQLKCQHRSTLGQEVKAAPVVAQPVSSLSASNPLQCTLKVLGEPLPLQNRPPILLNQRDELIWNKSGQNVLFAGDEVSDVYKVPVFFLATRWNEAGVSMVRFGVYYYLPLSKVGDATGGITMNAESGFEGYYAQPLIEMTRQMVKGHTYSLFITKPLGDVHSKAVDTQLVCSDLVTLY